jgi:hypothetical protein
MVGHELTTMAVAAPLARGLNLHAQKVWMAFDSNVKRSHLSPGLAYRKTPPCRLRHEQQLHPFPTFLKAPESLPILHHSTFPKPLSSRPEPEPTRHPHTFVIAVKWSPERSRRGWRSVGTCCSSPAPTPPQAHFQSRRPSSPQRKRVAQKEKARPVGRAFSKSLLYIEYQVEWGE